MQRHQKKRGEEKQKRLRRHFSFRFLPVVKAAAFFLVLNSWTGQEPKEPISLHVFILRLALLHVFSRQRD